MPQCSAAAAIRSTVRLLSAWCSAEEKHVPLLLDDALVSFDDRRLRAALDVLLAESEQRQILLFTCQTRERDYLAGHKNVTVLTL